MDAVGSSLPLKRPRLSFEEHLIAGVRAHEESSEGIIITASERTNGELAAATVQIYDVNRRKSHRIHSLTSEMILTGLSVAVLGGKIYIFLCTEKLYYLDPFHSWISRSNTCFFHNVPAVEMDGFLYVLGSENEEHGPCEKYDPDSDSWSVVGRTIRHSQYRCFVALKGWIYCICMKEVGALLPIVDRFHPSHGTWESVAPINSVNYNIFAATLNGKIYIIGNTAFNSRHSMLECYDPVTNVWTLVLKSEKFCCFIGLYKVNNCLYAMHKEENVAFSRGADIMKFDFNTINWEYYEIMENISLDPLIACTTMKLHGDYFVDVCTRSEKLRCAVSCLVEYPFFEKALTHDTMEKQTKTFKFLHYDADAVKLCLDFITTGSVPSITMENIEKLVHVADALEIQDILDRAVSFCQLNISFDGLEQFMQIAFNHEFWSVYDRCEKFVTENFLLMLDHSCFLKMELPYIEQLFRMKEAEYNLHRQFIRSKIKEVTENTTLKSYLKWVAHNPAERNVHLKKFFSNTRIQDVKVSTLKHVKNEVLVPFKYKRILNRVDTAIAKRQALTQVLLMKEEHNHDFYGFFPRIKKWKRTSISHKFTVHPIFCFLIKSELFIIDSNHAVMSVDTRELNAIWKHKTKSILKKDVEYQFVVTDSALVFAFAKTEAAKYDPENDSWTTITHCENTECTFVAFQQSIYALGGEDSAENAQAIINTVLRYNIFDDTWHSDVATMLNKRKRSAAIAHNGKIYALGGEVDGPIHECEVYDPTTNIWKQIAPMEKSFTYLKVVNFDNQLYMAVYPKRGYKRVFYIYNPEKDEWKERQIRITLLFETALACVLPYDITD